LSGLFQMMRVDLKVGTRNYTYLLYLAVAFAYGLVIRAFPQTYRPTVAVLLLFFEPALLGFTFVGTIVMGEKKDGTIHALSVTPASWRDYYLSKTLQMSLLGLLGAVIILAIGVGLDWGVALPLLGVFLTSVVYTLFGIGISAGYRDLDEYFVPLMVVLVISILPFAHHYNLIAGAWTKVLYVIPSYPSLFLLSSLFEKVACETVLLSVVSLGVWSAVAYVLAQAQFYRRAVEALR